MQLITYTPTEDERKIAALAHASVLLTFIVAVTTGGIGTLVIMLIPLFIWIGYKDRSPFVAFHALQSTLFQLGMLCALLGATIVLGAVLTAAWVITGLLSIVLVGLLLIPLALLLTAVAGVLLVTLPLVGLGYGLLGAWQVYNGDNFRYYWIADWLDTRI